MDHPNAFDPAGLLATRLRELATGVAIRAAAEMAKEVAKSTAEETSAAVASREAVRIATRVATEVATAAVAEVAEAAAKVATETVAKVATEIAAEAVRKYLQALPPPKDGVDGADGVLKSVTTWSPGADYVTGAVVEHQGSLWWGCRNNSVSVPGESPEWQLMVARGKPGEPGPPGPGASGLGLLKRKARQLGTR